MYKMTYDLKTYFIRDENNLIEGEYTSYQEARSALDNMNGILTLDRKILLHIKFFKLNFMIFLS